MPNFGGPFFVRVLVEVNLDSLLKFLTWFFLG